MMPNNNSDKEAVRPPKQLDFQSWAESQLALLDLEQTEGLTQHDLKKGVINKLQLNEVRVGTFGKTVLVLERQKPIGSGLIPVGSPVRVHSPRWGVAQDTELRGVVKSCEEYTIEIVCKNTRNTVVKSAEYDVVVETLPDETTLKRIRQALNVSKKDFSRWESLLLGEGVAQFLSESAITPKVQAMLSSLNESQRQAASLVARAKDVAVIHGPPGTGKTTTLVKAIEAIFEVHPNTRLLCCAPSNVAVDNLVLLLSRKSYPLLRLGHPSRVAAALQAHTLDRILSMGDSSSLLADVRKELLQTSDWGRKRELRAEIKQRETEAIQNVAKNARIVLATIAGAAELRKLMPTGIKFTHLIVDEAAQCMEAAVFVPLQFIDPQNGVLILAGDHKQLPPTILSEEASSKGLSSTLMERLIQNKPECSVLLSTQYRMNEKIMQWSSDEMYRGELKADESVANRHLKDLRNQTSSETELEEDEDLCAPLLFIDTAGCSMNEQDSDGTNEASESRYNPGEAEVVETHVRHLLQLGVEPSQLAVVTPYRNQVELIRTRLLTSDPMLFEKVEVRTVDGFQGQERECVVLSMVRSNPKRLVGFLADERRLNVAITRAKRHVCMVGDSSTLESNPFLSRLIRHFETYGSVRSAAEFVQTQLEDISTSVPPRKPPSSTKTNPNKLVTAKQQPSKATTVNATGATATKQSFSANKSVANDAVVSGGKTGMAPKSGPPQLKLSSDNHKSYASVQEDKKQTGLVSLLADKSDSDQDEEDGIPSKPTATDDATSISKQEPSKATASKSSSTKNKSKKKKSGSQQKSGLIENEEEDDDSDMAFLEQEAFAATRCGSYPACQKSIELIYHTCVFCKKRYCMTHCQAEKHGCGGIARQQAFQEKKDGKLPAPKMKAAERAKVHEKLQDKIKSQQSDRVAALKPKKKT